MGVTMKLAVVLLCSILALASGCCWERCKRERCFRHEGSCRPCNKTRHCGICTNGTRVEEEFPEDMDKKRPEALRDEDRDYLENS